VAKNLEDGLIHPLIESWYDWNMDWNENEEIKGDLQVSVLGTSALLAKEHHSQQLMQFLNLTANPLDVAMVDRRYLLREISKAMEIDVEKSVPDKLPDQPQGQQESQLDIQKSELLKAQVEKTQAETTDIRVKSQFEAVQTAGQVVMNQAILPVSDSLLGSAGYVDKNGPPIAEAPQGPIQQPVMPPENTSPGFPSAPISPQDVAIGEPAIPGDMASSSVGLNAGIETSRMD
jgi:hypothetical protein